MADEAPKSLTAEQIVALQHVFLGPTWKKRKSGRWYLPKRTLGWQIAGWAAQWLRGEDGQPWRFTDEQLRFVLWWYAVDDNGRFTYRTGVLQRMKGWGKDPLLAVLCLVELVGPSRVLFDEFGDMVLDEQGQPVGIPCQSAWVQVTAVNQSQTTNTMALLPSLMNDEFKAEYDVKDGAELIRARGGTCRLEAVTSSYRAIEGKRTTFTLLNETHHWVSGNNGHKMYETIDGNATKKDARYLAITNAYLPGEDSVAERMRDAYDRVQEGRAADTGLLYDSVEAHPLTPLTPEALAIVIPVIRGDAVWLKVEPIVASVQQTNIAPSRSRRMWLNQIVAEEDAIYSAAEWDPLGDDDTTLLPGTEIALGFDGGKTDDGTALVCIRAADTCAFVLGYWQRPEHLDPKAHWEVPRAEVDSRVREAFSAYDVVAFYSDVALWESYIADWDVDYGKALGVKASERSPISYDMRQSQQKVTLAHERLVRTILDKKLKHEGTKSKTGKLLKRHVLNARRRTNNYGLSFGKESRESPRKVDLYAALLLAHEALHDYRTRGKKQKTGSSRGWFM